MDQRKVKKMNNKHLDVGGYWRMLDQNCDSSPVSVILGQSFVCALGFSNRGTPPARSPARPVFVAQGTGATSLDGDVFFGR